MANSRQWEYDAASLAQAERHQAALDQAAGLPRESRPVTPGVRHSNPDRPDGKWMSLHLVDIDELAGPPVEYAVQRARQVRAHEGKTIRDAGGDYVIPDNTTAVDRAAKWNDAKPRRPAAANPIKART